MESPDLRAVLYQLRALNETHVVAAGPGYKAILWVEATTTDDWASSYESANIVAWKIDLLSVEAEGDETGWPKFCEGVPVWLTPHAGPDSLLTTPGELANVHLVYVVGPGEEEPPQEMLDRRRDAVLKEIA